MQKLQDWCETKPLSWTHDQNNKILKSTNVFHIVSKVPMASSSWHKYILKSYWSEGFDRFLRDLENFEELPVFRLWKQAAKDSSKTSDSPDLTCTVIPWWLHSIPGIPRPSSEPLQRSGCTRLQQNMDMHHWMEEPWAALLLASEQASSSTVRWPSYNPTRVHSVSQEHFY